MIEWDDFYNEPSEFEQQVDELKDSLMGAVKKEFVEEMDRLKKENAELQGVRQNLDQIKREYNQKVVELDMQKQNLKSEVRRERLVELMGDFKAELYRAYSNRKDGPKCNKCDEARNIYYKSPLGKQLVETCDCKNRIVYYEPKPHICSSFELRNGKFMAWYKPYSHSTNADGMEFEFVGSSNVPNKIYSGEDYELINERHFDVYFKTEEECQKYCDWLTVKEVTQ